MTSGFVQLMIGIIIHVHSADGSNSFIIENQCYGYCCIMTFDIHYCFIFKTIVILGGNYVVRRRGALCV